MPRLTDDDLDKLLQELTMLTRAGLPLPEGFARLADILPHLNTRVVAQDLAECLGRGASLSGAMKDSDAGFPAEFVAIIECAEVSGEPHAILGAALEQARRRKQIREVLFTAIIYPVITIIVLLLILLLVALRVAPSFWNVYKACGSWVPWNAQLVMAGLGRLGSPLGVILCLATAGALLACITAGPLKRRVAGALLNLPLLSPLALLGDFSVAMKFLAAMLSRRVPLDVALRASSLAATQQDSRGRLLAMAEAATRGLPVGAHLRGVAPDTAAYLFEQGEERGNLPEVCAGVADYCDARFQTLSRTVMIAFEPVLILLLGVIVGFVVFSLYQPLFLIPRMVQ